MRRTRLIIYVATGAILLGVIAAGVMTILDRQATGADQSTDIQVDRTYSANEVSKHRISSDCWTVINGSVYDLTSYINRHPGGEELLRACGNDATTLFDSRRTSDGKNIGSGTPHSSSARELLKTLKIGAVQN